MKYLLVIMALTGAIGLLHAQQVQPMTDNHVDKPFVMPSSSVYNAKSWIKKECISGNEYDLYRILDSGYVIVQEYVMMNCRPCITAGKGLSLVINKLRKEYPGRIKFFQTVFEDQTSCDSVLAWRDRNGFMPDAVFTKGAEEVAYYGGMGMPTIVILGGGRRHKGYYNGYGYAPYDNYRIMQAIKRALHLSKSKFEDAD